LISALAAAPEGRNLHITFHAADGFSNIKRAEYSIDAGDWHFVEPLGELSDAKTENYDFRAEDPPVVTSSANDLSSIEHVVVVRVYDRYDNMSAAKVVVRGK